MPPLAYTPAKKIDETMKTIAATIATQAASL
jgi:hypothetical protein